MADQPSIPQNLRDFALSAVAFDSSFDVLSEDMDSDLSAALQARAAKLAEEKGLVEPENKPPLTTAQIFWNTYSNILAEEALSPETPAAQKISTYMADDDDFTSLMEQAVDSMDLTDWQKAHLLTQAEESRQAAWHATIMESRIDDYTFGQAQELIQMIKHPDAAFAAAQLEDMAAAPAKPAFTAPEEPLFLKAYAAAKEHRPDLIPYIEANPAFLSTADDTYDTISGSRSFDTGREFFDRHFDASGPSDRNNILLQAEAENFFQHVKEGKLPDILPQTVPSGAPEILTAAIRPSAPVIVTDLEPLKPAPVNVLKAAIDDSPLIIPVSAQKPTEFILAASMNPYTDAAPDVPVALKEIEAEEPETAEYSVRKGDSLGRIIKNEYGVSRGQPGYQQIVDAINSVPENEELFSANAAKSKKNYHDYPLFIADTLHLPELPDADEPELTFEKAATGDEPSSEFKIRGSLSQTIMRAAEAYGIDGLTGGEALKVAKLVAEANDIANMNRVSAGQAVTITRDMFAPAA